MILWYVLFAVIYALYHTTFFSYSTYIFNYSKSKAIWGTVTYVINVSFWILYSTFFSLQYEPIAMLLFILILFLEYRFIFGLSIPVTIYISQTFSLNLLAKRIALIGGIPLFLGQSIYDVFDEPFYRLLIILISSGLSINTIALARKSLSKIYLDTILSDQKNILFLTGVFTIVNITIIAISTTFSYSDIGSSMLLFYVFSGVSFILAFLVFLIYAYQLANIIILAQTTKTMEEHNKEQELILNQLKEEASKDVLTGILSREAITTILQDHISQPENYFLVLIDIDGLKFANDNFGHGEGDFYINQVANVLCTYFNNESVGRYGGDEFLIIGNYDSEFDLTSRVIRCYTAVEQISKKFNKNYPTSISYGIVFSSNDHHTSAQQFIALGDQRMYEMKKLRQKQRKTTAVKKQ